MEESVFDEMKRYVRFGPEDEAALRGFAGEARAHFPRIADDFYVRAGEHEPARRVFSGPAQVERLKVTLCAWLERLLSGPWDDSYYEQRARIGRMHVKIGLPQRYMFGAMSLVREQLDELASVTSRDLPCYRARARALGKILDLELAIMLETYKEAVVDLRTRRAERLAALGTMASGLAHELRNPLNAAHLQLDVAMRRLARAREPKLSAARGCVELAQGELKRLAALVADFLQFARPQPLQLAIVDLRALARGVLAFAAARAAQSGVSLELEPGPPVRVELDEDKMKQVLMNLLQNAVEASPRGGSVRISVERRDGEACLAVQDAGCGVPASAPIFEPFFTTKDSGTGLGLAIVHRVALDHGGSVNFDSVPGRTVFSVTLPADRML